MLRSYQQIKANKIFKFNILRIYSCVFRVIFAETVIIGIFENTNCTIPILLNVLQKSL